MNSPLLRRSLLDRKIFNHFTPGILSGLLGLLWQWQFVNISIAAVNDSCSGSIALTNGVPFEMSTTDATTEVEEVATCAGGTGKGVWFTFTAPSNSSISVSTIGSSFDTVLQIFTGSCGSLTPVVCNDDNSPAGYLYQAGVIFPGTASTTYRILATGSGGQSGTLRMIATTGAPNDTCDNPVPLLENVFCMMTTTNANSTGDPVPLCQSSFGKGVWFKYVPPLSGTLAVSTAGDFDTVMAVYSGTCGALTPVACNDNNGPVTPGTSASASFSATGGTAYYILVGGTNDTDGMLSMVIGPVPANDSCAGATPLNAGGLATGYNQSALSSGDPTSSCATSGKGVWFSFTPAQSGPCLISTCSSGFDTVLDVFDGSCGAFSPVACADDNGPDCGGANASLILTAAAGHDYFIMVSGKNGDSGTIDIRAAMEPANDSCTNALSLANGVPANVDTRGALSAVSPLPTCAPGIGRDVWFQFAPASSGEVLVSTCDSDVDTGLQVYTGDCNSLEPLVCNDDFGPVCSSPQASVVFAGVAGTTYLIQVGGFAGDSGTLSIIASIATPPLNYVKSGNSLELNWTVGDTLQVATNLNYPIDWADVGTTGTYTETMTNESRFFRVKR